ncbi:hypothetical protein ONT07_02575 [Prevotella copri]|uniref:hypothetical protein n=1 Tax=Segatella copri TaxID=165179 RepID=UPI00222E70B3|nr:hypothetical protein [Segatella copri]MCW4079474.1 hypothetical protein [Segatella copri]MCW4104368.1 hypothetical protein [Segatella copri]
MIQIKRNNKVFFTLEDFGEGSKLSYQLMDHHYIILKFTTATPVYFEIGDSVEIPDFGYFELTSSYFPKHNDSDGYDYEMQMDAYYMSWKNKICKYRPQHGANETFFNLTTTVGVHMNVILGNLKALGLTYNGEDFSVDYTTYNNKAFDVQKRFLIEYGSISILDALNAICSEDALNCEWWIDGSIIYLGYCEMEGQTTFEQDVNVLSMSYSESKSTYITRLYAFGSDRNIPKGYFTGADADVTTDGVATDYLMLPNKEVDSDGFYAKDGYLENVNVVKNDKQAIEGVVMFEEEYPKVESVVSSIKTYDSTVDNEDGTKTTQTFWQVTSTDSFTNSFKESWIKSNLTLGIKFTSGALMGMEFDVSFKVIDKANYFEIVANDTYGRTLPDGVMCPKVGDKYFLFNWDATKITDTDLIPTAQLSLFDRAKQYYQKTMISNSNFTCTMDGDKFYNDGIYDYHPLGEQVKLINDMFAQVDADGKHYRNSRIIGMEIPLDIPYDHPQYIVGEKAATSRLGKLEDKVDSIKVNGMQIGGTGSGNGGGVYVIGMNDTTPASDSNVYSARRSRMEFVSRLLDNTAKGTITWEKVQKFLQGLLVGGGSWTPDAEGRSHLITDYLEVRMKAIFEELVINKTSTIGGKEIISPAGGVVAHKVEEVTVTYNNVSQKAYRCYFLAEQEGDAVDNDFAVGDQVRSESFNVRKGTYHKAGNHFYWRLVIGRDEDPVELEGKKYHYIDLSDTDCATASDVPAKGDVLNQCGNRTDVERQNCLIFSAVDTYSPSISLYHGINSYSFANREYVEYGVNKQNNKAFFNVYGDMYVGDRPTKENGYEGSSYIRYDSSTKQMSVKAKISAKSTVDGKELSQYFNKIAELQNQVDGAIETWFYDGVPTLENAPAISWKTDKDKEIHLGDLYYNNKTGKAYRFAKDSNTYKWTIITDTDIAKALSDARMAQETANGKMKVFSVQPTTPYQVGDIWVNATYPSDGSTYKNEVLRCQTNKAAGSQFAIGDWIKASKYTDDTVANAAKKTAEDAQKAAQTAQTDIKNLGKTVTDNKKEFDNYVTDGYLEPSEIAAMAQDSKRLEDDFAAAQKSYNEVKDAEVLKDTKELTDLTSAFTDLSDAKKELIKYLSDISKRYNETDTNGKAAIVSAVGTKFTNFQNAYSAFYDKLGLANAYITRKIYGDLKQNITDLAGYKYLKDALGQTTDIDGGLVMTTLLALRDGDGNVQSGINGAIDPNRGKKSIATWWGGQMVDKDYNSGNLTPATSLIRFDGSGYLANGAIWWDVSGKIHADPTSFIISEKNLGAYLIFFEPTWKEGSAGTSVADLVSLKPNAPFSKLGVSGDATFEGAISFHGIKLTYDATNKAIKIDGNLYATGGITAYGAGASTTGGGGGLNGSVKSYSNALKLTSESLSEIASAYSIKALDSRISSLEGGSAMNVSVSGSGNAVTAISKSGTTIIVTKGTTFLTSHQSLASYLTKTDAASLYQPKGNYLTAHQSLDGYVNEVATSGTGNAITSVSKSGKKLTFTKGATFLTSHQSLANYVTINDSRLSDSRYPKFANGTWYLVGDDAYIGDHNFSGYFCVKSANDSTRVGISLWNRAENDYANLWFDNTNINLDKQLVMNNKRIWIQGVGTAGGNNNRLTLVAGMPSGLAYNTSCRGTILYSNGIAFADPYNGNSNNDSGWIRHLETSANSGTLEIAVGDDASNEQIHFRWYNTNSSAETIAHDITVPRATGTLALTSQIPTSLPANGGNADKLDGYHANGLLTALSNSDKGISITVGGTTKSISNISVNYASSAGNADTVDGYHESSFLRYRGSYEDASVTKDGVGVYGWAHTNTGHNNFHESYGDIINIQGFSTWRTRFDIGTSGRIRIVHGINTTTATQVGYLAYLHDNVASATKLQTPRTIWGQSFDGTGNVNGTIYINNSDSENGAIILNNNVNANARISAIKDQVVFNTGAAIRFGATDWEYSDWAGLKYDTVANAIYLGIADGTVFNYYSNKRSNGTLKFPGITTITPDSGARIGGSGGDLYLGNGNNTNWVKVQDMCSQVNSSYWNITQFGSATFKSLTVNDVISCDSISVSKNAVIAGNLSVNGLINNKGILPTNYEVNNNGAGCYVSADALCSGITAITDSIPVDNLSIVYSNDNGTNWTNYNISNDTKFKAYANVAGIDGLTLGGNVITGNNDAEKLAQIKKNQLMFTFYVPNNCYSQVYFASVDMSNGVGVTCTVEYLNSKGVIVNTFIKYMTGWNQFNYINLSNGNTAYGVGNDDRRYIRFRFKHDQNTTALRNASINKIRIFAFTKYSFPTDRFMGHTGHIYNFDYNMNTYFPNSILAKGGVTAYQSSDIRLKQDLRKLDYLGIIKAMGGTYGFAWKKDNTRSIGWIAQHVLHNPQLKDIVETDEKGYYKINYWSPKLIATAFGAIEQVGDEVSRLKARVIFLESEVLRLSGDKEDCNKKRLDNKNINSLN